MTKKCLKKAIELNEKIDQMKESRDMIYEFLNNKTLNELVLSFEYQSNNEKEVPIDGTAICRTIIRPTTDLKSMIIDKTIAEKILKIINDEIDNLEEEFSEL